ncbi:LPXTG cell wall anchor domain-containing protein [Polycladomyces sp. WAk]|uniref:LPXTG cell wall anchor domain-containing protein n=1 Tax=Polycladomyces zharkentensis TaxID=2807616 RepID=A0ABS2WLU5_9BACL|nr:LPXTG cell wall anchor domain-containing protein [Polycladomyces sp. WAk]MBN2910537.1 LPXTG cell wall anchor domain-containing protein [Polycladomyces sp. WAk]
MRTIILTLALLLASFPVANAAPLDIEVNVDPQPVTDQVNRTVDEVTDLVREVVPPVVEPPVEEPPVDQPPVDEPPVDQPPVDQPPVDEPPVDQPPVDQPPVDEPPVDQPPVDQPPAEQPPVDQPGNEPPAEQPPTNPTPVDQPGNGGQHDGGRQVTVDKPAYSAPTVVQPEEIQQQSFHKSGASAPQLETQELPKTATPYPNLALAGGLLLVSGAVLYRFRPQKG